MSFSSHRMFVVTATAEEPDEAGNQFWVVGVFFDYKDAQIYAGRTQFFSMSMDIFEFGYSPATRAFTAAVRTPLAI